MILLCFSQSEDPLESATEALCQTSRRPGPPDELVTKTINAMQSVETSGRLATWRERTIQMIHRNKYAIAASAMVVAGLIAWLTFGPTGGIAIADVVENVKKFKTAMWKMTSEREGTVETFIYKAMEPGKMTWSAENQNVAIVADLTIGKAIMRNDDAKMVITIPMPGGKADAPGMLAVVQKLSTRPSKSIGSEDIDEEKCQGLRFENEGGTFEVWVSVDTSLPVLIVQETSADQMRAQMKKVDVPDEVPAYDIKMTWSDFEWGIDLDESEFSTESPEGYKTLSLEAMKKQMMEKFRSGQGEREGEDDERPQK